jgi:hypothetical protein
MSPGSRRGTGDRDKGKRGSFRRRKDDVSLADRLQPGGQGTGGSVPPGSVLPGQGAPQSKSEPKARTKGRDKAKDKAKGRGRAEGKTAKSSADARAPGTVLPGKSKAAPVPTQTRKQLREQREAQKQQARKRWLLTAIAVVVVVIVGVLLVLWLAGRGDDTPAASEVGRTEQTVTMTLATADGPATSGALMINDPNNGSAASVLIPSRLFVQGPTPDDVPFAETVLLGDNGAPGTALADTLDVIVDDTWQVSDQMLEELVNGVDGVLVDVDADVLDGRTIVVRAGDAQLLNGSEAVAFATYLGNGEVEEARLARFSQVLDQMMQRLPTNRDALIALLTEVTSTGRSTLSVEALADFALQYGEVSRGGDAAYQTLPVNVVETGGPNPALVVDDEGLARLKSGLLADSLPPDAGGDQVTVLVQNGVGKPGLEQDAGDLLRDAGYDFLNDGNANEFGHEETIVLVPDSATASVTLGESVAETLGVPDSAVQVSDQGSSLADVIVILGKDFKP